MTDETLNDESWNHIQIQLMEDRSRRWKLVPFAPSDAVQLSNGGQTIIGPMINFDELPEDARIIKDGWDHEHCSLCWKKISLIEGYEQMAYTDGKDWLCSECYEKYVLPREQRTH